MIPLCWKCAANEHKPDGLANSRMPVQCMDNPEIKTYVDARTMCPLLKEKDSTNADNGV